MSRLLIIADDLTGALDTGVQFSKQGIRSKTICFYENMELLQRGDWQVIVINSESRHLSPQEAYSRVYRICKYAYEKGYRYFYKKTDSGLRGNLGSELSAVMDATGYQDLYFAPSYPEMDRLTINGIHYWKGEEIHKTAFGEDLLNPVTSSNVSELIGQQTDCFTMNHNLNDVNWSSSSQKECIHIIDAEKKEDLLEVARRIKAYAPHLMAGCAGFASYLSEIVTLKKEDKKTEINISKILIISGSIHSVTQNQIRFAKENGIPEIGLTVKDKLTKDCFKNSSCPEWMRQCMKELEASPHVCIVDSLDQCPDESLEFCKKQGINSLEIPYLIADNLAFVAEYIHENCSDVTVFVVGGDTLTAVMKAFRCQEIIPQKELVEGTVWSDLVMENGHSVSVISKSGAFGKEDLFVSIMKRFIG